MKTEIQTGGNLIGSKIRAWFYPIKMKPFIDNAVVITYNSNWKSKKYKVKLSNGTKHRINHKQIIEVLM